MANKMEKAHRKMRIANKNCAIKEYYSIVDIHMAEKESSWKKSRLFFLSRLL